MDSLEQLLKEYDYGTRVSFENRWLVWDNGWLVLERKYQARRNTILYEGNSLTAAISALIKEA